MKQNWEFVAGEEVVSNSSYNNLGSGVTAKVIFVDKDWENIHDIKYIITDIVGKNIYPTHFDSSLSCWSKLSWIPKRIAESRVYKALQEIDND